MSHILDALRKLEQEKTRSSGPGGMVNISGDLLAGEVRPRQRRTAPGMVLAVALLLIAACGVTYWLTRQKPAPRPAPVAALPTRPPVVASLPPVSGPAAPVPAAVVTPAAAPAAPVVVPVTPLSAPKAAAPAAPVPVAVAGHDDGESRSRPGRRAPKTAAAPPAPRPARVSAPQAATIPAPADIKVLGVAWQDERSARRAVINGFLMQEGGMVSGARITDILTDRVRFSSPAGLFEVPLVTPGLAPAGK